MLFKEMSPFRRAAAFMLLIMTVIFGIAVVGAVSEYFEKRERVKAEAAEFWRRERMTPEQRVAENAVRAKAAKEAAQAAQAAAAENEKQIVLENGRRACLAGWMASLRDPDSAHVEHFEGTIIGPDEYLGQIFGRAKNGFGGYVRGEWLCRAMRSGPDVRVLSINQSRS